MPNVGVGTAAPASLLDASSATGGIMTLSRNDTAATSGESIGKIQFWNNDTQLTTQKIYGNIEMQAAQNITTNAAAGNMIFSTTGTTVAGSPVERMRINSAGYVGIGQSAPSYRLSILGAANDTVDGSIDATNTTNGSSAGSVANFNSGNGASVASGFVGAFNKTFSSIPSMTGRFVVGTNSDATGLTISAESAGQDIRFFSGSSTESMRLDSAGYVGLGTTPTEKLDVVGNIKASGQIYGTAKDAVAANAINFDNGNVQTTTYACAAASPDFTLSNMKSGGSYTLVVTNTGTTQCNFASTGDTFRFVPANSTRVASSHTVYTMIKVGTVIYVSWITGF